MIGFDSIGKMGRLGNQMFQHAAVKGIARKNRFSVQITPPTTLVSDVNAATINFLASAVAFPARAFGTTTYRSGGRFGLDVPYETTYEAVTLTMLNTNNHAPRKFWSSWFDHIMKVDSPRLGHNYNMQYYLLCQSLGFGNQIQDQY